MTALHKPMPPDPAAARLNMIDGQLRPNGVRDERILTAIETLPRERFVPPPLAGIACIDDEIPVALGRSLLRPMVFARMLQAAAITPKDSVLDIGAATGYSSAIIARMAKHVAALECDANLRKIAAANWQELGLGNITPYDGKLEEGLRDKAPFDVIFINGGVEFVSDALLAQLGEGGRLIAVVRRYGPAQAAHTGEARLYQKRHGNVSHLAVFDAAAEILPGFAASKGFSFQ